MSSIKNKSCTKRNASSSKETQATLKSINERLDSIEEALRLILVNMVMTEADECIERCGTDSSSKATGVVAGVSNSAQENSRVEGDIVDINGNPVMETQSEDVMMYDVMLRECKFNRIEVIKTIRERTSLTMNDAFYITNNLPMKILSCDSIWKAKGIQEALVKLGAKVDIIERPQNGRR